MAEAQTKDSVLGLVIQYVYNRDKPKDSAISKNQVQSSLKVSPTV